MYSTLLYVFVKVLTLTSGGNQMHLCLQCIGALKPLKRMQSVKLKNKDSYR